MGNPFYEAYLDIETTGLDPRYSEITVIGVYLDGPSRNKMVQLVGEAVRWCNLAPVLEGVRVLYTYNGSRFDLPFIREKLGVDLSVLLNHCDLMYVCWRLGLYGGLKKVEQRLGIRRRLKDIDGRMAVVLWDRYKRYGDIESLRLLLEYNGEDVYNLRLLKDRIMCVSR